MKAKCTICRSTFASEDSNIFCNTCFRVYERLGPYRGRADDIIWATKRVRNLLEKQIQEENNKRPPIQPIEDRAFVANKIVRVLLTSSKFSLDQIAEMGFPVEDVEQFWQLLGYNVDGYLELSFVRDETKKRIKERLPEPRKRGKR